MARTPKPDIGHAETDKLLEDLEAKIAKEYRQAVRDTQAKLDDYLRRFEIKDEKWRLMVANGEKTAEEYAKWRQGQIMIGKRWEEMRDTLAQDYHNANVIARSITDGYMPEVYALNHNYATFEVEKGALVDTSYTLYDRQTVERIMRDNPDLLPPPGRNMKARIAAGKDIRWQEGQIQSIMFQAVTQGERIPQIAGRIKDIPGVAERVGQMNHASTIRYARTAITEAENGGRQAGYERARDMGIEMRKVWLATLDNRTRHEHRILDGQEREIDEPYEIGGEKIMYPGDPSAAEHLVWNCRCSQIVQIKGFERNLSDLDLRRNEKLGDMTYEEWKEAHGTSERITKQEETGEAMRRRYVAEYRKARKK